MARRKTKLVNKTVKKPHYNSLQASDVLCPICRTILIEPVTLPCEHEFCFLCFNDTMENANLVCPLCRVRVGSWFRTAKKENKVINELLWRAIKEQYPREIQNKYRGIDNVIEEVKPIIVVANPGEIRKEYEIQKHREDEEFNKIKVAEEKASEELIRKLRQEEEYKLVVEEEKLKRDAEFAKKLALETGPSTSKSYVQKKPRKYGPMDKFVKNDKVPANKSVNNLTTKEYTCRVLCLEKDSKSNVPKTESYQKSVMPVSQKKHHQIQKVLDKEHCSRGSKGSESGNASDMIEMEYKYYFKPIESQKNINGQSKTPIRISSLRASLSKDIKIVPPTGNGQLNLEHLKSAFARFSLSTPNLTTSLESEDNGERNSRTKAKSLKRKCTSEGNSPHKKKGASTMCPIKTSNITKQIFAIKNIRNRSLSPPYFYGFDNSEIKKSNDKQNQIQDNSEKKIVINKNNVNSFSEKKIVVNKNSTSVVKSNDIFVPKDCKKQTKTKSKTINGITDDKRKKMIQEKADFEFAKKLQAEINSSTAPTSVSARTRRGTKRQVTLDEMLMV